MKTHMRVDTVKINELLIALISGITMDEMEVMLGSKTTAFRYLKVLEDVYKVDISNYKKVYKIEAISDDAIWRVVFRALD